MPDTDHATDAFPIVVLCGSAGSLKGFQAFFDAMPTDTGIAFVVLQHIAEDADSILPRIIRRNTDLRVTTITNGTSIEPEVVYVLSAAHHLQIEDGVFSLVDPPAAEGWPQTIDKFLISLAADQGANVAALIFSGVGDDGRKGAHAIRKHGGWVIAQRPDDAMQASMPQSVIDENAADDILLPREMPAALLTHFAVQHDHTAPPADLRRDLSDDDVNRVIRWVHRQTERDFSEYKRSTLRRQIARRMSICQCATIDDYLTYLYEHPSEADTLSKYVLINVTNFFRDPEAFEALKTKALLPTLRDHDIDTIFRVWVPGCATGEEAVSIAILLYEVMQEVDKLNLEVRLFATDAKHDLVQHGRRGVYPASIAQHVSEERLAAHFSADDGQYRVRKHIARMIIWSEHNLIENPPFSNLHLISCRNVLIYFQRELQKHIIALFQFGLRPQGLLFLGSSETLEQDSSNFETIDSRHKIFRRNEKVDVSWLRFNHSLFTYTSSYAERPMPDNPPHSADADDEELRIIRQMLLDHYDSTCLIVDESYRVRYTYGDVDPYLQLVPGKEGQNNILDMARPGLDNELSLALHQAHERQATVQRDGVWVKTNGDERSVTLTIKPITDEPLPPGTVLVIIEPATEPDALNDFDADDFDADDFDVEGTQVQVLRQKLAETQEALESKTQALQAKSEELASSMEQIRSANEEVQTTNEELRTSKEELESMNEELNSLNTQLTDQNEALTAANDTLHNFLQSTELGVIFLDEDLQVREFTQAVTELFGLREGDTGRPLSEINSRLRDTDLIDEATHVLDTLNSVEEEVQSDDGRWYELQIRPFRTIENVIDGVVLTFSDITERREAHLSAERRTRYIRQIFDTIENALLELDTDMVVLSANQAFYEMFQTDEEATVGTPLYKLGNGQWDIPSLQTLLHDIISEQKSIREYTVTHEFPQLGTRTMRLNARQIEDLERILLVITEVSDADSNVD